MESTYLSKEACEELFDIEPEKPTRYFLDQDSSGHWYCIPFKEKERWEKLWSVYRLTTSGRDFQERSNVIRNINKEFGKYRLTGGIADLTFTNPTTQNPDTL